MTDEDRISLRELLSEQLQVVRNDLAEVKQDVHDLKEHQAGSVTWRALGFAVTVGATLAGFIFLVVDHA